MDSDAKDLWQTASYKTVNEHQCYLPHSFHAGESENLLVLSMCLRLQVYRLVKSISIKLLTLSISNKKTLPKQRFIYQPNGLIAFL